MVQRFLLFSQEKKGSEGFRLTYRFIQIDPCDRWPTSEDSISSRSLDSCPSPSRFALPIH